nr:MULTISPECIES: ATP synthase F1 subunit delta [unclassified Coprococcus]
MVEEIKALVDGSPELVYALADPVVSHADKRKVVDRVFDRFGNKDLVNFMKTLCDNDGFDMIHDIFDEYEKYAREQQDILSATLYYVTPPTDKQKAGIENFLMKEYGSKAVQLSMVEKKELIGGFVIRTGDREYDRSILGRYKSLRQKLVMR